MKFTQMLYYRWPVTLKQEIIRAAVELVYGSRMMRIAFCCGAVCRKAADKQLLYKWFAGTDDIHMLSYIFQFNELVLMQWTYAWSHGILHSPDSVAHFFH